MKRLFCDECDEITKHKYHPHSSPNQGTCDDEWEPNDYWECFVCGSTSAYVSSDDDLTGDGKKWTKRLLADRFSVNGIISRNVCHDLFGQGYIVNVEGEYPSRKFTIQFSDGSTKLIAEQYCNLVFNETDVEKGDK